MSLLQTTWTCMIMFLTFSMQGWPLLPADCESFISFGNLTVEPAALFLMGSNVTVYCHINKCDWRYGIYLELNNKNVSESKRVNCTTQMFSLPRIEKPRSSVVCKMKTDQQAELIIVNGKDLRAGLGPDKPVNISCETRRSSAVMDCSWERGRETHVLMSYDVSLHRANGSQIHSGHVVNVSDIVIPRARLDENTKYLLNITAYNHFGRSQADPFTFRVKDIVIPETPHVIKLEFGNNSAVLRWKSSGSSERLTPEVRLRADKSSWELRAGAEIREGLIQVDNLRPLTEYEFQIRACDSPSGLKHEVSAGLKTTRTSRCRCSRWSPSVRKMSPPKVPSQQLRVWRILAGQSTDGLKNVTVLWQPPPPEDYSGELLQYQILLDDDLLEICGPASSQCEVQVPVEVQALSVRAVTSYGSSPPANVELRHADVLGPVLQDVTRAGNGSSVLVSWSSTFGGELLNYVVEWKSVPAGELQWKQLSKDLRNTSISDLTAGRRYNVSLYAVTTRGLSPPTSSLIYSKEKKPASGPALLVLAHESRRILVQWVELPVDQQRGFITKYTVYLQKLDSSGSEFSMTVSGSGPRELWLDCPEGALTLQMTASNSAGEGPRGRQISSQPEDPTVGLVIVIVFTITIFIVIVVNLMCWSCVRKRIKQKCVSWGPDWLIENLPKPGRSNAIRILEDNVSQSLFSFTYSDPPLSPILVVSQEDRDDVYPTVHVEESRSGSRQARDVTRTTLAEHTGYKPQVAALFPLEEEEEEDEDEEESRDFPTNTDEVMCSVALDGLLGGLVSKTIVDYSDSPQGLTLGAVSGLLWPKNTEMVLLNSVFLQERGGNEDDEEENCPCLDAQQDHKLTPDTDEPRWTQGPEEKALSDGYFPQLGPLSSATPDT